MAQMTWRTSDEVLERVRRQAEEQGRSLNDWVSTVLAAASDPDHAGSEAARIRERLARAGILAAPPASRPPAPTVLRDHDRLDRARARAGAGVPLADLVAQDRR